MMHYFDCISHDLANCTTETQNTSTLGLVTYALPYPLRCRNPCHWYMCYFTSD